MKIIDCDVSYETVSDKSEFLISPNPGKGIFTVTLRETNCELLNWDVYDQIGKRVFTGAEKYFCENLQKEIDLSMLNSGIYFMKISGETFSACKKLILE